MLILAERQKVACVTQTPSRVAQRVREIANGNTARFTRAGVEQLGVNRRVLGTLEKLIKASLRGATGASVPPEQPGASLASAAAAFSR